MKINQTENNSGNTETIISVRGSTTSQHRKPLKSQWLVFSVVAMALLMMTVDSTIVATALHSLQADLQTTVSWVGWTLTAYSFGFVLMLPLSAKLSIRFGHRRVFLTSILIFTVSSLLCGLSDNIFHLIVMRVIQAMGGAGITPSATGIIVDHFEQSRDRFLGLFGSIFPIGAMIGPIFGGLIVTYWSWHYIFFINIPLGITVILLSTFLIPKSEPKTWIGDKLDIVGLLFMAVGILSGMYAATYLGDGSGSPLSPIFVALVFLAIAAFTLLFRHLKKISYPFIQPRFITGKGFNAVNLVNLIFSGAVIGGISLVPLYAVRRYGISELNSGTLLVAQGLASVIMSTIMSFYLRKTGYRRPIYIGSVLMIIGLFLLASKPLFGLSPFIWLSLSTTFIGFGGGLMSPAARNAGIQLAPEQSANIAAIRSLGLQFGQIITISIATAIIAAAANPNFAQSVIYISLAVLLIFSIPIISGVPEHHGAW